MPEQMRTSTSTPVPSFLSGANAADVLACFSGNTHVVRYVGPHRFYRAAGKDANGDLANAYSGRWWADENVLIQIANRLATAENWMTSGELKRAWPAQYRALMALSRDWNDMSEIFQLELPAGATLEGLAGTAREQPEFSVKDPLGRHRPNRFLTGGAEQVYFKVKNPFWVRRVHLW